MTYDPFPKTGLIKQYESLIRGEVVRFCKKYPRVGMTGALIEAVWLAFQAEQTFKPELGTFGTHLRHALRGLYRGLIEREQKHEGTPTETRAQRRQREAGEKNTPPRQLNLSGAGNGARLTWDLQHGAFDPNSRPRLFFGTRLHSGGESHARGVLERVNPDVRTLLDIHRQSDSKFVGRMRAVLAHQERRQREAEAEAENNAPVFLEPLSLRVDVVPYRGGKRPKFLPTYLPMARLDDSYTHEDGWVGTLHDIIASGAPVSSAEQEDRDIQAAVEAERPFLSDSERHMLDFAIDPGDRTQSGAGAEIGLSKGGASKALSRALTRLASRVNGRK
jgi:hypothetical protein